MSDPKKIEAEDVDTEAADAEQDSAEWTEALGLATGSNDSDTPPSHDDGRTAGDIAEAADDTAAAGGAGKPEPETQTRAPQQGANEIETMRAEIARLQQQARSEQGRAIAYQRELEKSRSAAAQQQPPKLPETLQRLHEEYPELVEPIGREFSALQEQLRQVQAAVGQVTQGAAEAREAELDQLAPGWRDDLSKNADRFNEWLQNEAPGRLVRTFEANREAISDPRSAAEVVNAFRAHIGAPSSQQPAHAGNGEIASRRQRQMRGAISPTTRGSTPAVSTAAHGDDDAIFREMVRKVEGDMNRR